MRYKGTLEAAFMGCGEKENSGYKKKVNKNKTRSLFFTLIKKFNVECLINFGEWHETLKLQERNMGKTFSDVSSKAKDMVQSTYFSSRESMFMSQHL